MKMTKIESYSIGFFIGIICPLVMFVFFWWTAAALTMYGILSFSDTVIAIAALSGLGAGIVLDIVYLKKWIRRFYSMHIVIMALLYLFLSLIAVAFFMGFPLGNFVLGLLAGVYIGRRYYHAAEESGALVRAARNTGLFTAVVTSLDALPIGILALDEDFVLGITHLVTGLDKSVISGPTGVILVIGTCIILFAAQFWAARASAHMAYTIERKFA